MSFLRNPASLVEIINEEKSWSLKLVKYENHRTHPGEHTNFIYAAIYSFHPNMNVALHKPELTIKIQFTPTKAALF